MVEPALCQRWLDLIGSRFYLKHSTECAQHSLPERPRRGDSAAVANSFSRFRLAEPLCFRLDAIAGALLVIAPMQFRATCSVFQSRSSPSHHHRCSSCASTAIRRRRTPIMTPPRAGNSSCINSDQQGARQQYTNRPDCRKRRVRVQPATTKKASRWLVVLFALAISQRQVTNAANSALLERLAKKGMFDTMS